MVFASYIKKYFWGDNLKELNWEKHKDYISKTILEKGDQKSVNWLFKKADKRYIKQIVDNKNLDKKSKKFWSLYFS